jgi:(4-O-methyl)-D-glucuronate---lignin esterase
MNLKRALVPLVVPALIAVLWSACAPPRNAFLTTIVQAHDDLVRGFAAPPDSTRPWVYWMWMDGNLTREGITADLEAMKRAGIGGVVAMEVNVGIPRGPVEFMSTGWRRLFAHAVREAERLGLEITLNAGPGWTGSGGPWVKPELSMQDIVASATKVTGPRRFDGALPRPARRPGFFGDGLLPPDLEKVKDDYYRDVYVLAFPTPPAGGAIADIDEKALYVRAPYSSQPGVKPFLPSPADYPPAPPGSEVDPGRVLDLTSRLAADGRLAWDVPAGNWTILRFGCTSTGATTRPSPAPGLGLESDKLSKAALDAHFDAFIGSLLRELGGRHGTAGAGWTMLHIDSWEMGAQNWTAALRREFRRRRGYDLLPYLPAITSRFVGSSEISERFLWDLRQTANELVLENHAGHLKDLGHRHGFGLSIEPYDMTPCADLSLGAVADVPMGEFWLYGFNTFHSVIEAVSVAHTGGRPVVAAESFTSTDTEKWQAHPGAMKALGDWALAAGVNRIVFHRYQHQPWLDRRPGMTMGPYGVHWERTQTWWDMVPAYHTYLSRCQFMLRRGLPVADVLYLAAEGAPQVFRAPASATRGNPPDKPGYNFDGCAPETFLARVSVEDGRLVLPDGMSYLVLVLPERESMTLRLLRRVRELVESGATVIGPRPRKTPGLSGYPGCDRDVERLAGEVWGECDGERVTEHRFGRGRVIWEKRTAAQGSSGGATAVSPAAAAPTDKSVCDVGAPPLSEPAQYGDFATVENVLRRLGLPPDFESTAALRYSHRREGATDIYFVVNAENRAIAADCVFRVAGGRPELWDAVTGEMRLLPEFAESGSRTSVPMRFEPHQSFFIIFRRAETGTRSPGRNFPETMEAGKIPGPWEVSFDPRWGGPEKAVFPELEDWTGRPEEGIKYYSGTAVYRRDFDLPGTTGRPEAAAADDENSASTPAAGERSAGDQPIRWWLDLGDVKDVASVRLNGRDLGVVWCAPWGVDITGAVKPKGNRLEITVANLWPNRLIGDEQFPPDCDYVKEGNLLRWPGWLLKGEPRPSAGRLTFSTWKHFTKDSPLLPSGLLGPVTLRAQPSHTE